MEEPYIGEIKIFAGNFPPRGWARCDGQLLSINEYTALFSILGTTYGGDGRTTFALPNLQERFPMHAGTGPGLTPRRIGETGGAEAVALTASQIPAHTHVWNATRKAAEQVTPKDQSVALVRDAAYADAGNLTMADDVIEAAGRSPAEAHNNLQPFLPLTFIIALVGVFPPRS